MLPNYPVREQVGAAFELRQRMKHLPSCAHVLHKTLNLVISRRCLTEYGEDMYQIYNARAGPLFYALNPVVFWRFRCRRRISFF